MKRDREFDLLVRERRRDQSPAEADELRILLAQEEGARWLFETGLALDPESAVQPGDDALIQRLAMNTAKRASKRGRAHRPGRRWAPGVAVLGLTLITAAAAAAVVVLGAERKPSPAAVEVKPTAALHRAASLPREAAPASEPLPSPALLALEPQLTGADGAAATEAVRPARKPHAAGKNDTAERIFARASRARREGHHREAMSSYQRLLKDFPESAEADQARMSLAELNLQNDTPDVALKQFQESAKGTLEPDSLWGQAQALRRLERAAEERRVLLRLVRMFPDSPYTSAAKLRLHDLPN